LDIRSLGTDTYLFIPFVDYEPVGTGLGLHFCRDTVRSYGGEVGLDTEVGRGTTVTVYLPKAGV